MMEEDIVTSWQGEEAIKILAATALSSSHIFTSLSPPTAR
jgi:hypothetical protein